MKNKVSKNKEMLETLRNMVFKSSSVGLLQKKDIYGLTFLQRSALIYLSQNGLIKMVDFGRMLCVNKAALTRMIDSLQKRGFVRRIAVIGNRHGFNIALTEKGKNMIHRLDGIPLQVLSKMLSKIDKKEYNLYKKAFSLFLERLNQSYSS